LYSIKNIIIYMCGMHVHLCVCSAQVIFILPACSHTSESQLHCISTLTVEKSPKKQNKVKKRKKLTCNYVSEEKVDVPK